MIIYLVGLVEENELEQQVLQEGCLEANGILMAPLKIMVLAVTIIEMISLQQEHILVVILLQHLFLMQHQIQLLMLEQL